MAVLYIKNQEMNVQKVSKGENQVLEGPYYVPKDGRVDSLVVMLHGFGSNGEDLIDLAPMLAENLPHTAFYSPNGPEVTNMGVGYQWFDDNDFTFINREGIGEAKDAIESYLSMLSKKHNVPFNRIVLLGFSQGSMTSLFAAPRLSESLAGVIAFSGRLMWDEELKEPTATYHKMPVLLSHGEEDDVVPASSSVQSEQHLKSLGFDVELHLHAGLAHGIDMRGIQDARTFLSRVLSSK